MDRRYDIAMPDAAIDVDAVQTLAVACGGLALGSWIARRVAVIDRLNIPPAIVGGLVLALLALALRLAGVDIRWDRSLERVLMIAFFTVIGLGASFRLIASGGRHVVVLLVIAAVGAALQNAVGIGVASAFGLHPLLGVIAGSVSLTGGPGTAVTFGGDFEARGIAGATGVGVACAMAGITAGGLLGGWIGGGLVRRHGLRGSAAPATGSSAEVADDRPPLASALVIGVAMGIGSLVGWLIQRAGLTLPIYIGAMIAAAALRNLDDATGWLRISQRRADELGDIALSVFIVMAMLGLRLWEMAHLAGPVLAILAVQVALVCGLSLAAFRLLGRDYDAAVMAGGTCGFMLGTAANAMACMSVLRDKHGPAPRAFIVVPLVGVSLIDFFNALMIAFLADRWA